MHDAAPRQRRLREVCDVDLVRRTLIVLGIVALAYGAHLLPRLRQPEVGADA